MGIDYRFHLNEVKDEIEIGTFKKNEDKIRQKIGEC